MKTGRLVFDKKMMLHMGIVLLYAVLYVIVSYYHEPWFDEAQAWQIGKYASYKDILTVLTHTEGHPPLWFLILSIPGKLGLPYPFGLKMVSFVFSIASVILIIYKAPFPEYIKCALPFTYFLFYQYGVISRVYCVIFFLLLLIALCFENKDDKPFLFSFLLWLLSLSTLHGILIAFGICVCWFTDIIREIIGRKESLGERFSVLVKDRRIISLILLFFAVLPIAYVIYPYPNVYATSGEHFRFFGKQLLYCMCSMMGDAWISSTALPDWELAGAMEYIPGAIVTACIFFFFYKNGERKKMKYFVVPYVLLALLLSYYTSDHHTGMMVILFVFFLWISGSDFWDGRYIKAFVVFLFGVSTFYSILSMVAEVRYPYSEYKEMASFIKEHGMENAKIMISWDSNNKYEYYERDSEGNIEAKDISRDPKRTELAVPLNAYFDKNIFYNVNAEYNNEPYSLHYVSKEGEAEDIFSSWEKRGIPEVIIGDADLSKVYSDLDFGEYILVGKFEGRKIWKESYLYGASSIKIRRDCLKKYGF